MRNLHLILLQEFGIEARRLFREWEKLRLRSSDYRNHRIFSLRCIHKDLIPVSIKLKSTIDTSNTRQIIRKAEKDLLQARVKSINNILDQVDRQIQECRTKLASIISAERLGECQDFINKVSEVRFIKVKQRQINKLNHLVSKKEGNITLANAVNNITNPVNRQAHSPHNSHNPTLATALLPPGEGSNSPLATVHLTLEGNSFPNSQANNITKITINSANSHAQSPNHTLAIALLPPGEGSNSPSGAVHLPLEDDSSSQQTVFTPAREENNHTLAIAHLPPGEGSNSLPGAAHLPLEDDSSSQQTVFTPTREENNSSQATPLHVSSPPQSTRSPQAGLGNNLPRAGRQGNRHPPHNLPRRPVQPPRKATLPPHPQQGQPRFFK